MFSSFDTSVSNQYHLFLDINQENNEEFLSLGCVKMSFLHNNRIKKVFTSQFFVSTLSPSENSQQQFVCLCRRVGVTSPEASTQLHVCADYSSLTSLSCIKLIHQK